MLIALVVLLFVCIFVVSFGISTITDTEENAKRDERAFIVVIIFTIIGIASLVTTLNLQDKYRDQRFIEECKGTATVTEISRVCVWDDPK